jgi:diguanylate cyclase (GGDEF)-like protein
MQKHLLSFLCKKHALSYIIFDTKFHIIEADALDIESGSDIRDVLWELVGAEDTILSLKEKKSEIKIPMIARGESFYDLDIELFKEDAQEPLFIAYMQERSQQAHDYANVIKEINKKTLIYDTSQEKKQEAYYREIDKELITFHVDMDGIITYVNDACIHFFNLERSSMLQKHFSCFFDAQKSKLDGETNIFSAKNSMQERVYFHTNIIPLRDKQNNIVQNIIVAQDISYLKQIKKELEFASENDTLTGIPNRQYFLKTVDKYIEEYATFSLFFLDIDNFALVNEEYGSHAGDMLLKHIASLLQALKEPDDKLARLYGNTFALLFDPKKSKNYTAALIESIEAIKKQKLHYTSEDIITFDFTTLLLNYPQDATKAKELLALAKTEIKKKKVDKKLS